MTVRIVAAMVFGVLVGCGGEDPPEDTDEVTDDDPEPTGETGTADDDFTGKEGSIVLVHYAAGIDFDEYFEGHAVFADSLEGIINLAHCWPGWSTCVSDYPSSGSAAEEGEDPNFLFYADTYDVDPLLVGTMPDELAMFTYVTYFDWYWDSVTGWGGDGIVSLDGDLAPYTGTADFTYPTQMVLTAPDPSVALTADADDIVTLTWEPASDGMVILEWANTITVLEDDGSHDLVIADLEKSEPIDQLFVQLSRVLDTEVDAAGNTIHVQTRSEQILQIDYLDVGGYTELVVGNNVAEECEDAAALPPLGAGSYWGDLAVAEDDESPGDYDNSLTGFPAEGNDVVARIDLLAGQTLSVEYSSVLDFPNYIDASTYLLTDSCDEDDGLEGADEEYFGEPEEFDYTAEVDGPVYLVLDGFFEGGWFYWAEIEIEDPAP
jgi:hypothetical protein